MYCVHTLQGEQQYSRTLLFVGSQTKNKNRKKYESITFLTLTNAEEYLINVTLYINNDYEQQ